MNRNEDDKKLDWMYKGATSLVDREEYLLGRPVDKPLENLNQEERDRKLGILPPKNHVEHECIPPSIRDFNKIVQAEQVDLSAKLQEDPLVAIKKREEEARRQFLQNPIQLKKLQEALKSQDQKKKKKKKRRKSADSLDQKIVEKLRYLKQNSLTEQLASKSKKHSKDDSLDIILMHKYNQLKDSLSQEDLDDILAGRISSSSDSENSEKLRRERRQRDTKRKVKPSEDLKESNRQTGSKTRKNIDGYDSETRIEDVPRRKRYKEENRRQRRDSDDGKYGSKNIAKHITEHKRDYSSKKREKRSRDNSKQKNRCSSEEENSSEDESHKTKRKYSGTNQQDRKFKHTKDKKRQSDSSDSEDEKTKKKSKYNSRNYKTKYDSEDSDRKHKNKKLKKNRYQKDSSSSSNDSEDSTNKSQTVEKQYNNPQTITSDLDQMILKKLHMLRDNALSNKADKAPLYYRYDSDNDEPVYKVKSFGLIKSDGTKIPLKEKPLKLEDKPTKPKVPQKEFIKKRTKRLTSEEKEELRRQMMKDAEVREKERSINLRKYREDNKKEEIERNSSEFDTSFVHKELLKSTKSATVESRIKSNLNNIQRSSRDMSTNFSKRT